MESSIPEPEIRAKRGISPIWILPLVALLLAGWIAYKAVVDAGITVYIEFDNAQGIEKGKTRVMYRGMPIGQVKDISISKDFKSTQVMVEFVKEARDQLRKNTRFWVVTPRVSLKGISGLETILTGNYITMLPGDGPEERHFKALSGPPADLLVEDGGLNIRLVTDDLGSISQESGVFYKGIRTGEVVDFGLNDKGKVTINVHISTKFAGTINKLTRFYNLSGVAFEGGLSGFKVSAGALSSMLMGGIGYFDPDDAKSSEPAVNGQSFRLFKDRNLAEQEGKRVTLLFDEAKDISRNTQIKYKGVEIGRVSRVELNGKMTGIRAIASIQRQYLSLLREGTRFWVVKPSLGLSGAENLETIVSGTYITLRPGKGTKPKRIFKGLGSPPTSVATRKGLRIVLSSEQLGSIKVNDPVSYRQIRVGEVTGYRLSGDATSVIISVNIEQAYAPLVRTTTKFWQASGINIDFSLFSGAKVRTQSMRSILEGGIAFATPGKAPPAREKSGFDKARGEVLGGSKVKKGIPAIEITPGGPPSGRPVKDGARFVLHKEPKDEWLKWRPKIVIKK